jgi:hypothetical protein
VFVDDKSEGKCVRGAKVEIRVVDRHGLCRAVLCCGLLAVMWGERQGEAHTADVFVTVEFGRMHDCTGLQLSRTVLERLRHVHINR